MSARTLVWLRRDLRLGDNPALAAGAARGEVVPVFVWAPGEDGDWAPGAASRVWLHDSLAALGRALSARGLRLVLRRGDTGEQLRDLVRETGADAVYWNRLYEPATVQRDTAVKAALREQGVDARSFNGALFLEPPSVRNRQGRPFRVFTPFHRHCTALGLPRTAQPPPRDLEGPARWPASAALESLDLRPRLRWDAGIRDAWLPGETGAWRELESFADAAAAHYDTERDRPGVDGVSRLSPHLHFGEVSPQQVWQALAQRWPGPRDGSVDERVQPFTRQLWWREFAHHLLFHFPETADTPLVEKYAAFPWRRDETLLAAWQRGRTGYPLVDAGMRELWSTGWMHNRVRMNVASFLVKHLLTPWLDGARWFWDTLVDANLANNTLGWQWAAGCGADAAPYFRIFNPVLQGQRFDTDGRYVRRWVPELARLPHAHLHAPWQAPESVLHDAGVRLGRDYPHPVVDHREARQRALEALGTLSPA